TVRLPRVPWPLWIWVGCTWFRKQTTASPHACSRNTHSPTLAQTTSLLPLPKAWRIYPGRIARHKQVG
ncbi:hypothetical protein SARC_16624, partial [Sphaeroforma arctica JP610]